MKNEVDLLPELRAHVARKYKTQTAAAQEWGVSTAFVSSVLAGKRKPTAAILDDAGLEEVQLPAPAPVYVRKSK